MAFGGNVIEEKMFQRQKNIFIFFHTFQSNETKLQHISYPMFFWWYLISSTDSFVDLKYVS